MALITMQPGESAKNFETRLTGIGDKVKVNYEVGYTVAYSANSLILRQKSEVTNYEYRGLDQTAAEALVGLSADSVTTTVYYKTFGSNGDCAVVGLETGTRSKLTAQRDGDSRMWTVRRTDETMSAASSTGWTTTRPTASGQGTLTGKRSSSSVVARVLSGGTTYQLCSIETVETTRYRFRTYSEANSLVSNHTRYNVSYISVSKFGVIASVPNGTNESAQMQYVDNDYGFIVDVTKTTYSNTGW